MNKQNFPFIVFIFWANLLFGQTNQGSRLTAMGNNGTAVTDLWGVEANPATISNIKLPMVQLNYQKHFFANELSNQALGFVFPIKRLLLGLNLQRYGIQEYQNTKVGLVIAKQFGERFSIGVRTNYHQLKITNYGAISGISIDLGALYQLTDELYFGFYFNNLAQKQYPTKAINAVIPTTIYGGIAYQASSNFLIATTISKNLNAPFNVATGIDYQLVKAMSLRSGLSLNPFKHFAGIGFKELKFLADFTITKHPGFGYSPQISIGYDF